MTDKKASRRKFLKNAAIGTASVAATAGIAYKVVSAAADASIKGSDKSYLTQGDRALQQREYVEMSRSEKAAQIKMFVDNYKYEAV